MPHRPIPRLRVLRGGARLTDQAAAYGQAIAALRSRGRFGVNLGLARIEALLEELGHPERRLRGALVAGTNGKGSVVALIDAALRAGGVRTGTMPKPHLVSYRERIQVDGAALPTVEFARRLTDALAAADRVATDLGGPTEFEILTAAGFQALAEHAVDAAIVEVGLGGRLDATNAANLGVAVITTIQHDHERHLGQTLAAIGGEKAAIIKPGNRAVSGARGTGAAPVSARAREVGAPLSRVGPGGDYRVDLVGLDWSGTMADVTTPRGTLRDLHSGLIGVHQAHNLAVAVASLDALAETGTGRELDEQTIRRGFAQARWPGRLERLESAMGPIVLDGAHNPAGARALATTLRLLGVRDVPMIFGAMTGKRAASVLRQLAPLGVRPIFTAVDDPHALPPAHLVRRWQSIVGSAGGSRAGTTSPDPVSALAQAEALRRADQPILVTGSLYLVGAIRGHLSAEVDA